MNTLYTIMVASVTVLISCTISSCGTSKEARSNTDISATPLFQLKSGPCYGRCPIYHLSVDDKGMAILDKKRNMVGPGRYSMQMDEATILNIVRTLDGVQFMTLPDEYQSSIPDLPTTTMIYRKNGSIKTVKAKETLPQALRDLQNELELIIKNGDWTLQEAFEDPEASLDREIIQSELLVQPNEGVSLNRWQKRYVDYGLRLLTRIDKEQNIWLYTWDQTTISPQEMIAYIRKDADIQSVQYNSKLTSEK